MPLRNAERQSAYRARQAAGAAPVKVVTRKPKDRRSRGQRWQDAVAELVELQGEYQGWLDALPEGGSEATREALEAICSIDLSDLEVEPPRGFGRDEAYPQEQQQDRI